MDGNVSEEPIETYTRQVVANPPPDDGRYFLRLSTGAVVRDVPAAFCDDLDALTNDVEYLRTSDTFERMVYHRDSFPRPFLDWFLTTVVPLYNTRRKPTHPLLSARIRKDGRLLIVVSKSK